MKDVFKSGSYTTIVQREVEWVVGASRNEFEIA